MKLSTVIDMCRAVTLAGLLFAGCQSSVDETVSLPAHDGHLHVTGISHTSASNEKSIEAAQPTIPAAKAFTADTDYDFGSQPLDMVLDHQFRIRNDGAAPLTLASAGTTCSCIELVVNDKPIPPGGSGMVKLQWNTGKQVGPFSNAATIRTNDPKRELIRLSIIGMTRAEIEVEPEQFIWNELTKDQDAQDRVLITSQAWKNFRIKNIRSAVAGLSWEVLPADQGQLETAKAKYGQQIVIKIPAEMTRKRFFGELDLDVVPPGENALPIAKKVKFYGDSPKGLFLSGACQDGPAAVLGVVRQGVAKGCNMILKAKGFDDTFRIDRIVCEPSFIRCTATPMLAGGKNVGVFRVTVEIPAEAPECIYQSPECATIRLITNHPEKPELKFLVEFTVLP